MANRVLPHDLDAERAVISAAVLSPEALDEAKALLPTEEDFWSPAHRAMWGAILELDEEGIEVDGVVLAKRLRDLGQLDKAGGTAGVFDVIDATPSVAHVEQHAQIVVDLALQRRVVTHLERFRVEGHQGQPDPAKWAQTVAEHLQETVEDREMANAPSLPEILAELVRDISARRSGKRAEAAVPTGLPRVDQKLAGGFFRGNMYIAAARPGMGKTSFALERCDVVARTGKAAIFCGLEMPESQVAARLLSMRCGVPVHRVNGAQLTDEEFAAVTEATALASKLPMGIEDCAGMTVGGIRTAVRRRLRKLRRVHGEHLELGLVAVDYIQLVTPPKMQGRTRDNELGAISWGLKNLAKQLKCPVLALSQLNRSVENRPNKRPKMADLRESGSLEQDAYGILFLYRDSYYWSDEEKAANRGNADVCEVDIAKHRNGETGMVKIGWNAATTSFYPLEDRWEHEFGPSDYDDMPSFEEP